MTALCLGRRGLWSGSRMTPVRILVDSLADQGLTNCPDDQCARDHPAAGSGALSCERFLWRRPDRAVEQRPNTRLISLPQRRRTVRILREFLLGRHDILFYVKSVSRQQAVSGLAKALERQAASPSAPSSRNRTFAMSPRLRRRRYISGSGPCCAATICSATRSRYNKACSGSTTCPARSCPRAWIRVSSRPAWDRPANSRPRVLFVGSLRPFKQPQLLLDAAARFPEADFVLVGEGLMADELKARIEREQLSNVML